MNNLTTAERDTDFSQKISEERNNIYGLNLTQLRALHVLVDRSDNESMEECAKKIGITRRTLYNYLDDKKFKAAYVKEIDKYFAASRSVISRKLVEAASNPDNRSQIPAMTLYYKLIGELKDQLQVEVNDVSKQVQLNNLPLVVKKLLIFCLNGGQLDKSTSEVIESFCSSNMPSIRDENGNEMKVIEAEGKVIDNQVDNNESEVFTVCQI